ncbi:MAG: nuclear transport factor 2 family protein [Rhodospirillaceae bacterium]|nr:MAG: nuclear transport factor 2 family protein [Rhodospirillaceae bacterium]
MSKIDLIEKFLAAWAAQDVDGVMGLFADEAVFVASTGPEPGRTLHGAADIRVAIEPMFKATAGMAFAVTGIWGEGADYFATWTLSAPAGSASAGTATSPVKGIDHFVVAHDRITLKDAYRKVAA